MASEARPYPACEVLNDLLLCDGLFGTLGRLPKGPDIVDDTIDLLFGPEGDNGAPQVPKHRVEGNPNIGNPNLGSPNLGDPNLGNPKLGNPKLSNPKLRQP